VVKRHLPSVSQAPHLTLLPFWLGLLFFSLYLLGFSGELHTLNQLAAFTAGNNLAQYGRADINQLIWTNQVIPHPPGRWGDDGNFYPERKPTISLLDLPLVWLGHAISDFNAIQMGLLMPGLLVLLLFIAVHLTWRWLPRPDLWLVSLVVFGAIFLISPRLLAQVPLTEGPGEAEIPPAEGLAGARIPPFGGLGGPAEVIWLRPTPSGWPIELHLLLPSLIILFLVLVNLFALYRLDSERPTPLTPRWVALSLTLLLTGQMMLSASHLALQDPQARADLPFLATLNQDAQPGDVLWVPLPAAANAEEFSTRLIAYQDASLPAYIWFTEIPPTGGPGIIAPPSGGPGGEAGPQALDPSDGERIWGGVLHEAKRVWLFERGLSPSDPLGQTAARLNQEAFPLQETWFERSGKLTLYTLPDVTTPGVRVNVPFAGQLTLLDFALLNAQNTPGEIVKLRLTWQLAAADVTTADLPPPATVAFVHLLDDANPGRVVAQQDRLLFDLHNLHQSPLQPGQTVSQGYALPLPADLAPGAYSLIVGLYDATTVQRLVRADGSPDDFLYLTTITVNSPSP
jgi:hypothetical protein